MSFIAVDIGATNTRVATGEDELETIQKFSSERLYKESSEEFVDELLDLVRETVGSDYLENVRSIGVSAPGPVDKNKGTFDAYFFGLEDIDLSPFKEFGDVYMMNDCNLGAIGEYSYGGHDTENLVYVTMSSGIGGGVVLNGNLLEGKDGNAGEVGHFPVSDEGVECGCGGEAHWVSMSSGNRMPELAELMGHEFDSSEEIMDGFYSGDKAAEEVVSAVQGYNAQAISTVVNAYNPEKIVFSGSVAVNNFETLIEEASSEAEKKVVNEMAELVKSELEDNSVLEGLRAVCTGDFNHTTL